MTLMRQYWTFLLAGLFTLSGLLAQNTPIKFGERDDDLGDVSDAYQEAFFEALKQKGIENYELALNALAKARNHAGNDVDQLAILDFEEAKNLKALKRYPEAETAYLATLDQVGERMDVMEDLYDLYYLQKNYNKAIPLVQKLMARDSDYKEDLANLYARTKQYDLAIELLDELDESWGESVYRTALRRRVYRESGNKEGAIQNLEAKVEANPKNEQDYLNLIFLYSEEGDVDKAYKTAQDLLKQHPESELVHLALYKFYFDRGEFPQGIRSMNVVFNSNKIDNNNKYKVLSDFLKYVSANPELDDELEKLISGFDIGSNGKLYKQLGDYYAAKEDKSTALRFYEQGVAVDPDNYQLLVNTILIKIDLQQFESAESISEDGLALFPAQSLLYLLNGVARIGLNDADGAVENLEMGLEFVLDDPRMERDFYQQLSKAYDSLGNTKKAATFREKAASINLSN